MSGNLGGVPKSLCKDVCAHFGSPINASKWADNDLTSLLDTVPVELAWQNTWRVTFGAKKAYRQNKVSHGLFFRITEAEFRIFRMNSNMRFCVCNSVCAPLVLQKLVPSVLFLHQW